MWCLLAFPGFQYLAHPLSLSYRAYNNSPPLLALRNCTILCGFPEIMLTVPSNAIASFQKGTMGCDLTHLFRGEMIALPRVSMTPVLNALN